MGGTIFQFYGGDIELMGDPHPVPSPPPTRENPECSNESYQCEESDLFILFAKYEQKNLMRAISITMDLTFQLKVLIINKSKNTHHKYQ